MIRALIFDFDGLIMDSESSCYSSWQQIFRRFGHEFPVEYYLASVGSSYETTGLHPFDYLVKVTALALDFDAIEKEQHDLEMAIVNSLPPMPGVVDQLDAGRQLGLKMAVASSSPRWWVAGHLERLGLLGYFDVVRTSEDVERIKPAPDLFLSALDALSLAAHEAVVLEDSPNGIAAARAAGILTVAVPNAITRWADLSQATLRLDSLADVDLKLLLSRLSNGRQG